MELTCGPTTASLCFGIETELCIACEIMDSYLCLRDDQVYFVILSSKLYCIYECTVLHIYDNFHASKSEVDKYCRVVD
jgi:hypothetical protein